MLEYTLPSFYIIDSNGKEQKVDLSKLRIKFQDGNNITIKVGICGPEGSQQVIITGHHGNTEEDQIDERCGTLLSINPASGNVIFVKPISFERKLSAI